MFRHLNEEATKTKTEKENETKRWTTFMQTPNRPIPKSPQQLESERRQQLRYQIKICKQPKPKCDPNRAPSPDKPKVVQPEPESESEPVNEEEKVEDVEVKNVIVPQEQNEIVEDISTNDVQDNHVDPSPEQNGIENGTEEIVNDIVEDIAEPVRVKSEEELMLEKQLCDVQKQLLALSTLPLTIQATLDAVTKQLAQLMPALHHQQMSANEPETNGLASPIPNEGMTISPH